MIKNIWNCNFQCICLQSVKLFVQDDSIQLHKCSKFHENTTAMLCCFGYCFFYAHHVYVNAIAFSRAYPCLKAFQLVSF